MEEKTVLLADDVELFLELEKTFFRRGGFRIVTARTGLEVLELVAKERPDLIFMDLYMPGLNGDEACRRIKADRESAVIPVVIVTQAGREQDIARCRQAGCDDIVLKPINRHDFLATARRHLGISDRLAPRVAARLEIRFGPRGEEVLRDFTVNLSTGGVFLQSQRLLAVDTELQMEFSLPARDQPIRCRGQVAWLNDPGAPTQPHLPGGMGLRFLDLDLADLEAVRNFIRSRPPGPAS